MLLYYNRDVRVVGNTFRFITNCCEIRPWPIYRKKTFLDAVAKHFERALLHQREPLQRRTLIRINDYDNDDNIIITNWRYFANVRKSRVRTEFSAARRNEYVFRRFAVFNTLGPKSHVSNAVGEKRKRKKKLIETYDDFTRATRSVCVYIYNA